MSIRKNRIACQGVNNFSQIDLIANKSVPYLKIPEKTLAATIKLTKTIKQHQTKSKYDSPNMALTTQNSDNIHTAFRGKSAENFTPHQLSNQISQHQPKRKPTLLCSKDNKSRPNRLADQQKPTSNSKVQNALEKIRNIYKYNANVRKIIKAWGFQSKGCISDKQFAQVICRHFDPSITTQECQQLFANVSGRKESLDLLSFIKIVFDQQPFTKPHINVLDPMLNNQGVQNKQLSSTLVNKIQDLNEGSLFKNMGQNMQKSFILPHLRDESKQTLHKMSNSFTMDTIKSFQKTQPSLHQTLWSQSNPKYTFSTTKSHGVDFTPTQFYGKNQQKTRFGATVPLELNEQSLLQNKRQRIVDQKMKVMDEINSQVMRQKSRYQNKLQKIRQYREREKQNINQIDKAVESREQANMKRFREENLAYNYVNFIHNDWK